MLTDNIVSFEQLALLFIYMPFCADVLLNP